MKSNLEKIHSLLLRSQYAAVEHELEQLMAECGNIEQQYDNINKLGGLLYAENKKLKEQVEQLTKERDALLAEREQMMKQEPEWRDLIEGEIIRKGDRSLQSGVWEPVFNIWIGEKYNSAFMKIQRLANPLYAKTVPQDQRISEQDAREIGRLFEFELERVAFESFAEKEGFDMSMHPLHYLFLDNKTYVARDVWRAAMDYSIKSFAELLAKLNQDQSTDLNPDDWAVAW